MAGIDSYSITPATNATIDGGNGTWAEGQLPSTVNNTARQMCADLRAAYNDLMWFQYGTGDQGTGNLAVPGVYASGTSFTITGANVTSIYEVGRRVRAVGTSTGTIYGSITASSYASNVTTVTVAWDSGSLSNETLTISLSQIPVTGSPLRAVTALAIGGATLGTNALAVTGTAAISGAITATSLAAAAGSLTNVALGIGAVNTGFISPSGSQIGVVQGGTEVVLISGSNIALGNSIYPWSVYSVFETGAAALAGDSGYLQLIANAYYDSAGNFIYKTTNPAASYEQGVNGEHQWLVAPSGTAGSAVAFNQAMTLDNSGNLLVGYTSSNGSYPLQVNGQIFATSATIATSDLTLKNVIASSNDNLSDALMDAASAVPTIIYSRKDRPQDGVRAGYGAQDWKLAIGSLEGQRVVTVLESGKLALDEGAAHTLKIAALERDVKRLRAELAALKAERKAA